MLVYLAISGIRRWPLAIPHFAAVLLATLWNGDRKAIWSPYYSITVNRLGVPGVAESAPAPEALRQRNPPVYLVKVNQFAYHCDGTLDLARYDPNTLAAQVIRSFEPQYGLPYQMFGGRDRVLVVGAGGGMDVEAALRHDARHVDAVEIYPAVVAISRRYNAGAPYSDPRVSIFVDDAWAYLARAQPGYDLVIFGFLDSQALFSTMSNVRLDGYVYTVESLRSAFRLLDDHGALVLSFGLGRPWMGPKLFNMMAAATGRTPAAYVGSGVALTTLRPQGPRGRPAHERRPLPADRLWKPGAGRRPDR